MEQIDFVPRKIALLGMLLMGVTGLLCGGLIGYGLGRACGGGDAPAYGTTVRTDTVRDTARVTRPVPVDSTRTGVIRIPVVVPVREPDEPEIPKATVKVWNPDSILSEAQKRVKNRVSDTVWATIPRTQKRYEDSTYTAWVSGYGVSLDSINVRRVTVVRTVTVTRPGRRSGIRDLRSRLGVGITGGAGYGLITKRPDVWIGIGGTVRLW